MIRFRCSTWSSWRSLVGVVIGLGVLTSAPLAAQAPPVFELDTLLVPGVSRLPGGAVGRVVTLLDREALLRQPVRNISEAVGWALGSDLQARSPAQADLSLRGASHEGVLVLVDGVRMSDPQTGHFDLDLTVPLEQVERIEVLLGPASAQFGSDAVGGVVNIVTRNDWRGAELRTERGSFDRWALAGSGGARVGAWSVGAGGEYTESDGHRSGTDYEITMLNGRVSGAIGPGRLGLSMGHADRDFGAADFYGPFPAFERTGTTTATIEWIGLLGAIELAPRYSFRRHSDVFTLIRTDPSVYQNNHVSEQQNADLVARVSLGAERMLAVGGEWRRETIDSNLLGLRDQDRIAAFGELTTPLGPVRVTAGLRIDRREDFETFLSPSLSAALPLSPGLRLRAQAGRAFRTPTWTERFYQDPANLGTPDLSGERSWSVEGGFDLSIPAGGLLRATVFRRSSSDLIDWARPVTDPDARWRTRNVDRATFDGLEVSAAVGSLQTVQAGVYGTWLDIEAGAAFGFQSKSTLRPLVRTVGVTLERELPGASHLRAHLRDQTRVGEKGVLLLDAQLTFGIDVGQLFVGGTNLTDASYADVSTRAAQGRALTVGLRTVLGR